MNQLPANAGELVEYWRRVAPSSQAVCYGERSWTWAELAGRVDANAAVQYAAGLRAGDRVAVLDKNHPAHLETALACLRTGTVMVPVNHLLPVDQARYLIGDAGVRLLFVGAEFGHVADVIAADIRVIVIGGDDDDYEQWLTDARYAQQFGGFAATSSLPRPPAGVCCAQVYTSGTTGFPKGAMITGANLTAHAVSAGSVLGFGPDSALMSGFGVYHAANLAFEVAALYHGGRVVVTRDTGPETLLHELEQRQVTHILVVPSTLSAFLEVPDVAARDYSHLRSIMYGATAIAPSLLRRCLDTFPAALTQGYGMTETAVTISILPDRDHRDRRHPERLASVGRPIPGVEIEVCDLVTGEPLGPGQVGEIRVRSPQVMLGYWDGAGPDDSAITPDGWLRTGDAGQLDSGGYLYITGRIKDMYINDGWNVYAAVVERVLGSHPDVAEAAVIGVPDDTWGEVGLAFLIPAPGAEVDEADVLRHCREHLADYECPASLVVVPAFPRNPVGKVVKEKLREQASTAMLAARH